MLLKIKKYIPYISILWFLVILEPQTYIEFWNIAFYLLLIVMFSRPIKDIFSKQTILAKIVWMRKELWILTWVFAIVHSIWYFLQTKLPITMMIDKNIWNLNNSMAWGIVAFIVAIPLTLTSNIFSMKTLGWKNWKRLQSLAYIMFFATLVHIGLISPEKETTMIIIAITYSTIYLLAHFLKIKRQKNKS